MYQYFGNTDISMYSLLGTLSFLPLLVFNLFQHKKKKEFLGNIFLYFLKFFSEKNQLIMFNIFSTLEIIIISLFQYAFTPGINLEFGKIVGTGANYFGLLFFSPLLVSLICFMFGINFLKQLDLITPAYPLALIVIKFACFCAGCCNGIPCNFGLYNHKTELIEFPVQLVESGLALLIFIFLMLYKKKAKEGTMFPLYMIIYSCSRFFSEFLRADPDIIWRLKTYHLLCIVGFIVGLLELFFVRKYKDNISLLFINVPNIILRKMHQYAIDFSKKVKAIQKRKVKKRKERKKQRAEKLRAKKGFKIIHHKKRKRKI